VWKLKIGIAWQFDPKSGKGGLNAGVLQRQTDPANAYLKQAFDEVERIRADLQAKTEVSKADLIAFAGAVAIEATGSCLL
jgi:catalase (peroxidase I)